MSKCLLHLVLQMNGAHHTGIFYFCFCRQWSNQSPVSSVETYKEMNENNNEKTLRILWRSICKKYTKKLMITWYKNIVTKHIYINYGYFTPPFFIYMLEVRKVYFRGRCWTFSIILFLALIRLLVSFDRLFLFHILSC